MRAPAPFPWRQAMAVGFGLMRLSPAAFWSMTPRELAAVMAPATAGAPERSALVAMMQRYPDLQDHHAD